MGKIQMKIENVCAIIVTYNPDEGILNLVKSIKDQVEHIFIVDNGSNQQSVDILNVIDLQDNIEIIYLGDNYGIAKALNKGVNLANELGFKWVITFDQDSICDENMIGIMKDMYSKINDDKIASLSPIYIDNRFDKKIDIHTDREYNFSETVITSGNLVNVSVLKEIGMFEDDLFIDAVDFDICMKLLLHGYKIVTCNKAYLYHNLGEEVEIEKNGIKIKVNVHSSVRKYYMYRNHMYLMKKYFFKKTMFCLKRNYIMMKLLIETKKYDPDSKKSMFYIRKGIKDGITGKFGRIDNSQEVF